MQFRMNVFRRLFALNLRIGAIFLVLASVTLSVGGSAQAQVGPLTVGIIADRLHSLISDINQAGSDLIQQGNNAAAEQQFLLAGLLQGTLDQIDKVYGNQMRSTVESVGSVEKDAFLNLDASLSKLNDTENKSVNDLQSLIQQTQSAGNQLLSSIPFTKRYPVFSGLQTHDVLAEVDQSPKDIRIIGFWLIDPELKTLPTISVLTPKGDEIPLAAASLTPFFDHIDVQLPDALKQTLQFQNTPCEPRKTFRLKVKIFYQPSQPWWKLGFFPTSEAMERTFNIIPGSVQFSASMSASWTTVVTTPSDVPYSVLSPETQWSCEENRTQNASFALPSGATLLSQNAQWAEIGGRWENQGCSVATAGSSVIASCWARGGNKNCVLGVCDCPGGGHGKARVFGTYRIQNLSVVTTADAPMGDLILSGKVGGSSFLTLPPRANSTYSVVNIKLFRSTKQASCPTVYDQISINLPTDTNPGATAIQRAVQTSAKGEFQATADQTQVSVQRLSSDN